MDTEFVGTRGLKPWGSPAQMQRATLGYQVDWERTSDYFAGGKVIVKLNGAIAIGADELTVDPLTRPLKAGDKLQGPDVKTVLVKANGGALITATEITVDELPGPIPAGALLNFGQAAENVRVTTAAAEGATTILTDPLPNAIEDNDEATYQGGEVNLEVLEDVAEGETTVPVGNVLFAIADDTELIAQRSGFESSDKFIPEGTVMALDGTSKKMFPRRDADPDVNTEVAFGLIASDASNSSLHKSDSRSGYGLVIGGTTLWENLLPDADSNGDLSGTYKTELAANTLGFTYRDYTDNRI